MNWMNPLNGEMNLVNALYFLFSLATAMIGYHWHRDGFCAVIDFFFAPIVWMKWIVCKEVNWSSIKACFTDLLK